jgi:hypothetical protein
LNESYWGLPQGVALLFALMVVTGPSILLFADLFLHGLTGSGVEFFMLCCFIYSLWCGLLIWRRWSQTPFRWWQMAVALVATCAVPYVTTALGQVVRAALPGLYSLMPALAFAPSFKEDTLWAWIIVTFIPWILVQFAVFIGFGMRAWAPEAE